jgi:2-methylcitrate dehydratase PrpD
MNGNELVVRFVRETRWDSLPPPVQRMAHMALLDNLGATVVGALTPVSRITAENALGG